MMAYTVNGSRMVGHTHAAQHPRIAEIVACPLKGGLRVNKDTPIPGTRWKLGLDLGVNLDYTETSVVAASPWIDDYAVGESEQDAVRSLLLSLVDFRESLERRSARAQLSDELSDTLWKLGLLLVKVTAP